MAFPASVDTVTLTVGPLLDAGGMPRRGVPLTARLGVLVKITEGGATLPTTTTARTDETGEASLTLVATDSAGVDTTGFTYRVSCPGVLAAAVDVPLPAAAPTVAVESLVAAAASDGTMVNLPLITADAAIAGLVADTGSDTRAAIDALGGGGGAVSSVNGETGAVVLTAADVGAAPALGADDNYVTDAEKAALHGHANKTALDAVSGVNTGDQTLPTWSTISGKPAVVAEGATQADARAAIGAVSAFASLTDVTPGTPDYGSEPVYDVATGKYVVRRGPKWDPARSAYNLTPAGMMGWLRGVGRVRAGTADANVWVIGDSTCFGSGYSGSIQTSPITRLAGLLSTRFATAHNAATLGRSSSWPTDSRVTLGSGWGSSTHGPGGGFTATTSATGDLSFTPAQAFDTITVYAARNSGLGTSTINVDGGASLGSMVTSGSGALATFSYTVAHGTHTINIQPPTVGPIFILGIAVSDSTSRAVRLFIAAKDGASTVNYVDTSEAWRPYYWPASIQPDLTIINLAINDSVAGLTPATYTSRMSSLITQAKTYGSCLLVIPHPLSTASAGETNMPTYRNILYSLADAHGVPLLDLRERWTSHATASTAGYMDDTLHQSALGSWDIAEAYASILAQGGADAIDAADLGSGAATDGYVLTADGAGGAAWEAASGGGATTLDGLTDVATAGAATGEALVYDGSGWVPSAAAAVLTGDSRLTDARTPTAHKTSHATGGSDALTAADIGAAATSHNHAASEITLGTVATARLGSGTASASTFLRGDQAWATSPKVLLATESSSFSAATTFSSIPSGYSRLRLEWYSTNAAGGGHTRALTFNGDTGANYASSGNTGSQTSIPLLAPQQGAQSAHVEIEGYAGSGTAKIVGGISVGSTNAGNANYALGLVGGAWLSASAITSLTITPSGTTVSTTYRLYGVI